MSLIGLDIGTTGCKSVVFDAKGTILGQGAREYAILTPNPQWAEQDAEAVWRLALEAIQTALSSVPAQDPPRALALSVQGEAVIPVDRESRALRHAILGMDTRTGEENAWLDTSSKGAILGLTLSTNRATLAKGILEGLTYELRVNLDLLRAAGVSISELHAVGGGAKSPLWLRLKADIGQVPLCVPQMTEAACLGAALLAGAAAGVYPNLETAVAQTVHIRERIAPDPATAAAYQGLYETYQRLYPALKALHVGN